MTSYQACALDLLREGERYCITTGHHRGNQWCGGVGGDFINVQDIDCGGLGIGQATVIGDLDVEVKAGIGFKVKVGARFDPDLITTDFNQAVIAIIAAITSHQGIGEGGSGAVGIRG